MLKLQIHVGIVCSIWLFVIAITIITDEDYYLGADKMTNLILRNIFCKTLQTLNTEKSEKPTYKLVLKHLFHT